MSLQSINGPIKFIYAIRDGLFKEHLDRIKFFDKIITVIPHIDTSNSSEKLKALLKVNPTVDITDEDCYGLGAFIKDKIQYNEYFHSLISEHFPKLLPVFIVRHIKLYVANINSFIIGPSTIVQLLQSTQINKTHKTTILNKLSPDLLYADNNTANEVCQQVAHIGLKNLTIDLDHLVHIINKSTNKESKLKCVIKILEAYPFTQKHTSQLLSALGGQYARTPQRKQAKWPLNEHSKYIANYIVANAYEHIKSNPREEIDGIRVYTKKPQ